MSAEEKTEIRKGRTIGSIMDEFAFQPLRRKRTKLNAMDAINETDHPTVVM